MPIDIINFVPFQSLCQITKRLVLLSSLLQLTLPSPRTSRPDPLIQTNSHGIHGTNLAIKCGLEVAMRTETLLDETASSALGPQRQALEPLDVCVVEEHVTHSDDTLVNLVGVASQDDTLGYDTVGGWRKRCSCCNQAERRGVLRCRRCASEVEKRDIAPGERTNERRDC
jgi:hypothetical protein